MSYGYGKTIVGVNTAALGAAASLAPELQPKDASLMQKALFLPGPAVALMPNTTVPDPLSVRYQHGWVDGATAGLNRGVLAGTALGALAAWLLLRK